MKGACEQSPNRVQGWCSPSLGAVRRPPWAPSDVGRKRSEDVENLLFIVRQRIRSPGREFGLSKATTLRRQTRVQTTAENPEPDMWPVCPSLHKAGRP